MFVEFALYSGAVDANRASMLKKLGLDALKTVGAAQGSNQVEVDPVEQYVEALRTLLDTGHACLVDKTVRLRDRVGAGEPIGWVDGDSVLINPSAALPLVQRYIRDSGSALTLSAAAVYRALLQRGYVDPGPDGKPLTQVRVGGSRARVLRFRAERLDLQLKPEKTAPGAYASPFTLEQQQLKDLIDN
jgi:hypothetical protein